MKRPYRVVLTLLGIIFFLIATGAALTFWAADEVGGVMRSRIVEGVRESRDRIRLIQ